MSSQEPVDTDRTVVTTYVPAYQKAAWEAHADDLDMSQSEFVRSMVQAGRRGFGATAEESERGHTNDGRPSDVEKGHSTDDTPGVGTRKTVLQALDEHGPLTWDELVEAVIGDLEDDLEEAVIELTEENRIRHQPRHGAYTVIEE